MVQEVKEADRAALTGHLKALTNITTSHQEGGTAYARLIGMSLFEDFLDVEERFQRGTEATEQEIIDELRQVGNLAWFVIGCICCFCCAAVLASVHHAAFAVPHPHVLRIVILLYTLHFLCHDSDTCMLFS